MYINYHYLDHKSDMDLLLLLRLIRFCLNQILNQILHRFLHRHQEDKVRHHYMEDFDNIEDIHSHHKNHYNHREDNFLHHTLHNCHHTEDILDFHMVHYKSYKEDIQECHI